MNSIIQLQDLLDTHGVKYEIIKHDQRIHSVDDAKGYFEPQKLAPVLIIDTEKGLFAYIKGVLSGKINFAILKSILNCNQAKMACSKKILQETGFNVGTIPLIGLSIPCIFDQNLLQYDFIYGGTGDLQHTLKINPYEIKRFNNIIAII